MRHQGWDELFEEVNAFCLQHNIIIPNMMDTLAIGGGSRGHGDQLVAYLHYFNH